MCNKTSVFQTHSHHLQDLPTTLGKSLSRPSDHRRSNQGFRFRDYQRVSWAKLKRTWDEEIVFEWNRDRRWYVLTTQTSTLFNMLDSDHINTDYVLCANSTVIWRSKYFGLLDHIDIRAHIRASVQNGHDLWFEFVCSCSSALRFGSMLKLYIALHLPNASSEINPV